MDNQQRVRVPKVDFKSIEQDVTAVLPLRATILKNNLKKDCLLKARDFPVVSL